MLRCAGGQIAIFFKKMHFSGRKRHFFKKFILFKNVQWPKIQFFSVPKKIFLIQSKVNIFHQIQPKHRLNNFAGLKLLLLVGGTQHDMRHWHRGAPLTWLLRGHGPAPGGGLAEVQLPHALRQARRVRGRRLPGLRGRRPLRGRGFHLDLKFIH